MNRIGFFAVLLVVGCSPSTNGARASPSMPASIRDDTLVVMLGAAAVTSDGRFTFTFVRLVSESRCAANVVCVWEGDAAVRLKGASPDASAEATIHTALEPKVFEIGGARVSLLQVHPYPGTRDSTQTPTVVLRVIRGST